LTEWISLDQCGQSPIKIRPNVGNLHFEKYDPFSVIFVKFCFPNNCIRLSQQFATIQGALTTFKIMLQNLRKIAKI
jgi:hypothetical protein